MNKDSSSNGAAGLVASSFFFWVLSFGVFAYAVFGLGHSPWWFAFMLPLNLLFDASLRANVKFERGANSCSGG